MPAPIPLNNGVPAVEAPAPDSLPRVPQKEDLATVMEREKAALEKGLDDAGLRSTPTRTGLRRLGKSGDEPAKGTPEAVKNASGAATEKGPAKPASPLAPSQASLSAGYAKLQRKEKAAIRREQEIEQRATALQAEEARIRAGFEEVEKNRTAWMTEQQAKLEELRLLDSDEITWLEKYAARRGTTPSAVYDKLMRRVLNDGAVPVDDRVEAVQRELAELKERTETEKRERTEREEKARQEWERRNAEQVHAQRVAQEKQGIAQWVTSEAAEKFPLLSAEDPAELAEVAYQVAHEYFNRTKQAATFEQVAAHLERQLQDAKILEEHRSGKTDTDSDSDEDEPEVEETEDEPKPEISARGNGAVKKPAKPEATRTIPKTGNGLKPKGGSSTKSGPKTLTHSLASQRSGAPAPRPRDDNERLDRALAAWNSGR